jgi:RNA polymerase sigma-70 factor (ECF subfamily)
MSEASTTQLQGLIERLRASVPSARSELIAHAYDRLRRLTRKMLPDCHEDVLQNALVRLTHALEAAAPASVADTFRLAALQIRRELTELAHHSSRRGTNVDDGSAASTPPLQGDISTKTWEPEGPAFWQGFHEHVEALPVKERETFDLLWYHGLTQAEAAAVLNVPTPTIKNWWLSARLQLQEALKGLPPNE